MSMTALIAGVLIGQDLSSYVKKFTPEHKTKILLLGTYHFANPGLDLVKSKLDDHLSPKRQAEIEVVRDALVRFKPTAIALEWPKVDSETLTANYDSYLKGTLKPVANERVQLGFALAKMLNLKSVEAIDYTSGMDFAGMMKFASERGLQQESARFMATTSELGPILEKIQNENTVGETLRLFNSPLFDKFNQAIYVRMLEFTAGTDSKGAEVLAEWHKRNLIMMSYISQLAKKPEDRILVILGSSHTAFMREMWANSLDFELVDPLEYLPPEK
ncbi:MAG: hypothetical protein KF824_04805 [Fimbriimonadaceae bacterium]|nr:MAG: hypothetical protein KF824_04805 [Fimbriimonadaceae bacterium]